MEPTLGTETDMTSIHRTLTHIKWGARMGLAAAGLALLLTGCAGYVTTNVTAFQNWPGAQQDRTYAFVRSATQNNLEQGTYEQMVGGELALHGFTQLEARQARYAVALAYGVRSATVVVPQPVYYDPWWPGPRWRGGYGYAPFGPPGPVAYVDQAYPVFDKLLTIRMVDRTTQAEVYNVTATLRASDPDLLPAMPYLARSALLNFPLANGTITQVRLPEDLRGGAGLTNGGGAPAGASAPAAQPGRSAPAAPAAATGASAPAAK
jgi:hypothetical protein